MIEGANLEAEKDLLSIILGLPNILAEKAEKVHPDLFYDPFNKKIIAKIRNNVLEGLPVEISTITDNANEQRILADLKLREKSPEFFDSFYKILEECLIARSLQREAKQIIRTLEKSNKIPPSDVLHLTKSNLENLEQMRTSSIHCVSDFIDDIVNRYEEIYTFTKEGVKFEDEKVIETPFASLNRLLKRGGLTGGNVYVVAATPSTGKTEICLNMASHAAIDQKKNVFVYSLEMTKDLLVERLLLERSKVDNYKLDTGTINDIDLRRLKTSAKLLKESNLFFEDNMSGDIYDVITSIRKAHYKHGLDLAIVDYLQLMNNGAVSGNRTEEVSSISRIIKKEAVNLNIPILLISQLSRAHMVEHREPALHDLRESGAIEQDADIVLFLYATNKERNNEVQTLTKAILAKQRQGPVGLFFLKNQKTVQTFIEIKEIEYKRGERKNTVTLEAKSEEDLPF